MTKWIKRIFTRNQQQENDCRRTLLQMYNQYVPGDIYIMECGTEVYINVHGVPVTINIDGDKYVCAYGFHDTYVSAVDKTNRERVIRKIERTNRSRFGGYSFHITSTDNGYMMVAHDRSCSAFKRDSAVLCVDGKLHKVSDGVEPMYKHDPKDLEAILQDIILSEGINRFKRLKHDKKSYTVPPFTNGITKE